MHFFPVYIIIATLLTSWFLGFTPLLIPALYSTMSLLTFLIYAWDKSAARKGNSRIAEVTLHWLSLLCGWPGAIIAQQLLRHKTVKADFRGLFWITVVMNCIALLLIHTDQGVPYLNSAVSSLQALVTELATDTEQQRLMLGLLVFR